MPASRHLLFGLSLFASAGAGLVAAQEPAARSQAAPNDRGVLQGRWTLNAQESEDARAKMREAMSRGGAGGGGAGGGSGWSGHGGHGGHGGYGGHTGGGSGRGEGRPPGGQDGGTWGSSLSHELMEAPGSLTITGNEAELTLDPGDGSCSASGPTATGSSARTAPSRRRPSGAGATS